MSNEQKHTPGLFVVTMISRETGESYDCIADLTSEELSDWTLLAQNHGISDRDAVYAIAKHST